MTNQAKNKTTKFINENSNQENFKIRILSLSDFTQRNRDSEMTKHWIILRI